MNTLNIAYTKAQEKVFFESKARFKTIAKGRRLGFTRGCANYVIECLLDDDFNIKIGVTTLSIFFGITLLINYVGLLLVENFVFLGMLMVFGYMTTYNIKHKKTKN